MANKISTQQILIQKGFFFRSCQNLRMEGLSQQCPMTVTTMFQAFSLYKSCKWKHSAAYGNYSGPVWSGSAWLTCDYSAISVQLQLQLPTETELGSN